MQATPVSMASRKLVNSSANASASPTTVCFTPGGRFCDRRQRFGRGLHGAERLAVQLDLEVDVARAVVAVDLRRPAGERERGHVAQRHRPLRARHRQALDQRQVLPRRVGQLHDHRHLALRQVQLGEALLVVARGSDAQRVGDRRRGDAEIGRARRIGPHDEFGPLQRRRARDLADAGDRAQFLLDGARMRRQHVAVFTGEHEDELLRRAAEADGEARARQHVERAAQLAFDLLLAEAAALAARREVDRQRRLARLGRAAGQNGSLPDAPPPTAV